MTTEAATDPAEPGERESAKPEGYASLFLALSIQDRALIIRERSEIAGTLLLVWTELLKLAFQEQSLEIERSDSYIGKAVGLHRNTVTRARTELVRLGLLTYETTKDAKDSYRPVLWKLNPSVQPCRFKVQPPAPLKGNPLHNDPPSSNVQKRNSPRREQTLRGNCFKTKRRAPATRGGFEAPRGQPAFVPKIGPDGGEDHSDLFRGAQ